MLCLRKPSDADIRQYLMERKEEPLQYQHIYGTKEYDHKIQYESDPKYAQYDIDQNRIKLGTGRECFERAVSALKAWKEFDLNWVNFCFNDVPIAVGETIGILSKQFGFWILSFCKINYIIDGLDEDSSVIRWGFAYGTLKEHVEKGEERFLIEWHRDPNSQSMDTGDVYFEILSFSEPQHWMTQLGYPVARFIQHKFCQEACDAMLKCVSGNESIRNV
ncbi:hypothetical protein DLAC_11517 [Tieghemostelium lacteum]|uniref:DUF1990 domain-containing protein n=1 Tax=Tieghemostelium lacteum TaxID=361077 RepID=A0A152A4U7_TIELA|nr:hypothetical protein DLAC_11517 [Tieghemostelium lacteum]|eukprot:KYR01091.1 hypothetical protein DLAC_11517 [Tieghemostelium lacteum]